MASNEIDKEQEKAIDLRPNYFAGQYLLEDDFQLEQKYHIDRQRRHNRLLHVSGIAEGLKVSPDDKKVKVSAGTAIDSQGRQIILPDDQSVELEKVANTKPLEDGGYTLSIRYEEEPTEKQDSEESMARRVQEKPKFELSKSTTPDVIPLAMLTIKGGKVENIDRSVRQYSGICLPTEDGEGVTLRSQRDENSNYAQLNGGLSISGTLSVTGHTQLNNTLMVTESTIINNNLTVKSLMVGENETGFTLRSHGEDNPNLAVLSGSLNISGTLAVTGESTLTGNVNAQASLKVHGITELNNTLTAKEKTTFQKDLEVKGDTHLNKDLTVKENTTLQKDLNISGNLLVTGMSTLTGCVNIFGEWEMKIGIKQKENNQWRVKETAKTDGFVVAWIEVGTQGHRGHLFLWIDGFTKGGASVHLDKDNDKWIGCNSLNIPVKKGETWELLKSDSFGECKWGCNWIPLGKAMPS